MYFLHVNVRVHVILDTYMHLHDQKAAEHLEGESFAEVEESAQMEGFAEVEESAQMEGFAEVEQSAQMEGFAEVEESAQTEGFAEVEESVWQVSAASCQKALAKEQGVGQDKQLFLHVYLRYNNYYLHNQNDPQYLERVDPAEVHMYVQGSVWQESSAESCQKVRAEWAVVCVCWEGG